MTILFPHFFSHLQSIAGKLDFHTNQKKEIIQQNKRIISTDTPKKQTAYETEQKQQMKSIKPVLSFLYYYQFEYMITTAKLKR